MKIAILGGTGEEGLGLAIRYAAAGDDVIIGSRSLERAEAAAEQVRRTVAGGAVSGATNDDATAQAEMVLVSVPFGGLDGTLTALASLLAGKIVVSLVVPLEFGRGGPRAIAVAEGSAAERAKALAPEARIVSAFQNLSAHELMEPGKDLASDVVVCSDDREAKRLVMDLAEKLTGVRAVDGGPLRYSAYVENLTALLIGINGRYKTQAGVRITGLPERAVSA